MAELNAGIVKYGVKNYVLQPKEARSSFVEDVCNQSFRMLILQSPQIILCDASYPTFPYL